MNKKAVTAGMIGIALATGAVVGAQISVLPTSTTTSMVQNADGSESIKVNPAAVSVAQPTFTLSKALVQEQIQRYTNSIAIDQSKLASDQEKLSEYQGYLAQFP